MKANSKNNMPEGIYFLSDVLNAKVLSKGKKIGKLSDLIIVDKDRVAEVTHLVIVRPFGYPFLMVPWEKVRSFGEKEIVIDVEDVEEFACKVPESFVLLKDYILDKKILDMEDTEVEVVYDIKMVMNNKNKLYVTDVDPSRYARLRRTGLNSIASIFHKGQDQDTRRFLFRGFKTLHERERRV